MESYIAFKLLEKINMGKSNKDISYLLLKRFTGICASFRLYFQWTEEPLNLRQRFE